VGTKYKKKLETVNVVLKRLSPDVTWQDLVNVGLQKFGKGNPGASKIEEAFPLCNTPWFGDYITIRCEYDTAKELEKLKKSDNVEWIRTEWETDADGNPMEYDPIMYTIEITDEEGNVTGTEERPIGVMTDSVKRTTPEE